MISVYTKRINDNGYIFNISKDILKVSINEKQDGEIVVIDEFEITLDEIKLSRHFSSCTMWAIDKINNRPFQVFKNTISSKDSVSEYLSYFSKPIYNFFIIMKSHEDTFEDANFIISQGTIPILSNREIEYFEYDDNPIIKYIPQIVLEQKTSFEDDVANILLYVKENDVTHQGTFDIYLESHIGYLPIRHFKYTGVPIEFKVSSMLLDKNAIIKIKAGYKYFTGISSIDIEVK